jgi:hypothetical protein
MLSSEGSTLTSLILARQSLICCALELDARYEAMLAIADARSAAAPAPASDPAACTRRRAEAELTVLPSLIADLEGQIGRAWRRLDTVSPRVFD